MRWRSLASCLLLVALAGAAPGARADAPPNPLTPPDRSSPRATLVAFLAAGDAVAEDLAQGRQETRAGFFQMVAKAQPVLQALDLSQVPNAYRKKGGSAAAMALYETLSRIPLPPVDEIPDAAEMARRPGADADRWTLPGTEITLARVKQGPGEGEFRFSPETVSRALEFGERTRHLTPLRPQAGKAYHLMVEGGGWLIPARWLHALPPSMHVVVWNQAVWKWIAFALLLLTIVPVMVLTTRISRVREDRSPVARALAQFAVPLVLVMATPFYAFLALVQINLQGEVAVGIQIAANIIVFVLAAMLSQRAAPVIAELILATPRIAPGSIDAHLIRLTARLVGIAGALVLLALGASRLGIPVYGIVAGLGVGGIAVALSAQPTLENLIAGLNLFADRPLRVGDTCKVGEVYGVVESIGLRSTRLRTRDRTVVTIPNGALAKSNIRNMTARDRRLINTTIGLRYETTPAQVRSILAAIEGLLKSHPKIVPDGMRVRLTGLGPSSLDVLVRAQVGTTSSSEYTAVQQEIFLNIMDIVEQCGSSFAFPSTTVYLGQDRFPGQPKPS